MFVAAERAAKASTKWKRGEKKRGTRSERAGTEENGVNQAEERNGKASPSKHEPLNSSGQFF